MSYQYCGATSDLSSLNEWEETGRRLERISGAARGCRDYRANNSLVVGRGDFIETIPDWIGLHNGDISDITLSARFWKTTTIRKLFQTKRIVPGPKVFMHCLLTKVIVFKLKYTFLRLKPMSQYLSKEFRVPTKFSGWPKTHKIAICGTSGQKDNFSSWKNTLCTRRVAHYIFHGLVSMWQIKHLTLSISLENK